MDFRPCLDAFQVCGMDLRTRLDAFQVCGMDLRPRVDAFPVCGMDLRPCVGTFPVCGMDFRPRGGVFQVVESGWEARVSLCLAPPARATVPFCHTQKAGQASPASILGCHPVGCDIFKGGFGRIAPPPPAGIEISNGLRLGFSLAPRGTSGERVGERGRSTASKPPLPSPLLHCHGGEGEQTFIARPSCLNSMAVPPPPRSAPPFRPVIPLGPP